MSGIKFALVVAVLTVAIAATAAGPSSSGGSAAACFGAAAHDPNHPCDNPQLRHEVVPSPAEARTGRNAPCTIISANGPLRVCEFGTTEAKARATVALIGDSHAAHWRAAVEFVADAEHWRGLSLTLSGCPYSAATRVLRTQLRELCIKRNLAVPGWLDRHPEIHTVFVSELSGARWRLPRSRRNAFDAEADAYVRAWRRLPPSVRQIIVIRDTPKATAETAGCIERAQTRGEEPGAACALARRRAVDPDAAVQAAHRPVQPRLRTIDMTRYFCDAQACPPVIGGALVQKDLHHLSVVFVRTLGPYLLDAVRRLGLPLD